jgi:MFS family permease
MVNHEQNAMQDGQRIRLRNLTILLGSTLIVLAGATIAPALPDMAAYFQDVPNVDFLVRLVLTLPALIIAIGALFSGVLLDRWGRKPVLIVAMILYGMAGFSGYILDSLFGILVGRAFLGLAVAGVMSGFTTLIGDYFEGDELNRFMGIQASVVAFGAVVFVLAGGFLADVGWRYPFLIYLLAFAVLPGVLFAIDEPVIQRRPQNQDNLNQNIDFPLRTVLFIYAITLVGMVVLFIVPVQLPFYLTKLTGASNSLVGVTLALQTLVAAVVSLQYQRIKKRLSFITITGLFFLTLGVGYIIVALAQGYAAIITGLLISGLGLGLYIPNSNVWLVSVVPAALRGRAVGGLTTALFLGQFLSPILTLPIAQRIGLPGVFAAAGIVMLLFAAIALVANRSSSNLVVASSKAEA